MQYFERLTQGIIPDVGGLIDDLKLQQGQMSDQDAVLSDLQTRYPQEYSRLMSLPPEQRAAYLRDAMNGGTIQDDSERII